MDVTAAYMEKPRAVRACSIMSVVAISFFAHPPYASEPVRYGPARKVNPSMHVSLNSFELGFYGKRMMMIISLLLLLWNFIFLYDASLSKTPKRGA